MSNPCIRRLPVADGGQATPGSLLVPASSGTDRGAWQDALSRLAARDCIESVLQLRQPSVDQFAEAVHAVDERQRRYLPDARPTSSRWWWAAAPPAPVEAPDLGSADASATAAEIWRQAIAAGLAPFDRMTFRVAFALGVGRVCSEMRHGKHSRRLRRVPLAHRMVVRSMSFNG